MLKSHLSVCGAISLNLLYMSCTSLWACLVDACASVNLSLPCLSLEMRISSQIHWKRFTLWLERNLHVLGLKDMFSSLSKHYTGSSQVEQDGGKSLLMYSTRWDSSHLVPRKTYGWDQEANTTVKFWRNPWFTQQNPRELVLVGLAWSQDPWRVWSPIMSRPCIRRTLRNVHQFFPISWWIPLSSITVIALQNSQVGVDNNNT